MKRINLRKILVILLVIPLTLGITYIYKSARKPSLVRAVGDLTVDFGNPPVPLGDPVFTITNMLPGDIESREIKVTNDGTSPHLVMIRGERTGPPGELDPKLETILDLVISEGSTVLYANKLSNFFEDSSPDGVELSTVDPGQSKTYNFEVTFPESSGNEFQEKSVIFDLFISVAFEVPAECLGIDFSGDPILGTDEDDDLDGTNGNDLIVGFGGDDRINGSNGKDCLIGGEGNDRMDGDNNEDLIFGGDGNDRINGGNGDDRIDGGIGNDDIDGGNGSDEITAGEGDDIVDGGNGNDVVNGGAGDDNLRGRNGNDTLVGDGGVDLARGDLGTDTCDAETEVTCEI